MIRLPVLAVAAASLSACATMPPAPVASVSAAPDRLPPPAHAQSPHDALFALFAADDEATLELNPMTGISRGDRRHADRLGDMLSPEYDARMKAQADRSLAALHAIDRAALSPTDRIAYDVFEFGGRDAQGADARDARADRSAADQPLHRVPQVLPHLRRAARARRRSRRCADYENNLSRNRDYVAYIDRAIGKFREGLASGRGRNLADDRQRDPAARRPARAAARGFALLGPGGEHFPADFSAADKARLTARLSSLDRRDHRRQPPAARFPQGRVPAARADRRRPFADEGRRRRSTSS